MQMNSKELLTIKKKFKDILKDKQVYDVVLFGSFVKGKIVPRDIDVVILSDKNNFNVDGFHISVLNVYDFFSGHSLVRTLLREGYSLKKNKFFAEIYGFNNVCLFKYDLSGLSASQKVSCVNFLRGKKGEKGLVFDSGGEWISNQVFFCPVFAESVFERFFINKKIKFKKFFCLID